MRKLHGLVRFAVVPAASPHMAWKDLVSLLLTQGVWEPLGVPAGDHQPLLTLSSPFSDHAHCGCEFRGVAGLAEPGLRALGTGFEPLPLDL